MNFITRITGIPTTGSYGPDGNPSGINNNGGTETTPQDAGNVPSAGTKSREGVDNDKSISANAYNQSASSTDAQAIGPSSSNPNMGNKYKPDAQRLFNSQFRDDPLSFPLERPYVIDSFDHYKNKSPAGSIEPVYENTFNIAAQSVNTEGSVVGSFVYDSSGNVINGPVTRVTTSMGGTVFTSVPGTPNIDPGFGIPTGANSCEDKQARIIDNPCEIVTCEGGLGNVPLGKKMRVFQGQGCEKSGYWVQHLISSATVDDSDGIGVNCDNFTNTSILVHGELNRLPKIGPTGDSPGVPKNCNTVRRTSNCLDVITVLAGISGNQASATDKFYAHRLMYVGTSLAGIKNKEYCSWEGQPEGETLDPLPVVAKSGHREWFFEGTKCNADGTRNETAHSGKLYGCCCKSDFSAVNGQASGYTLTQVADITLNSSDDPCDCKRRYQEGAQFLTEWSAARYLEDKWVTILMTGCNKEAALDHYISDKSNLYCLATGRNAPQWSPANCAWYHDLQRVVRCDGDDPDAMPDPDDPNRAILAQRYCPSGSPITNITDRNLFPTATTSDGSPGSIDEEDMINYAWCATGTCTPACSSGAPLFSVGDYVNISSVTVTGLNNRNDAWESLSVYDISNSGASNGSGFNTDAVISGISGCGILNNSWRVTDRAYGGKLSSPDSFDCTWGYQIEFTGCAPCRSGTPTGCAELGTGMVPNFEGMNAEFIPEAQLTSGSVCAGGGCGSCSSGDSLFEAGDYVNLTSYIVSGYRNIHGGFSGAFVIDLTTSGAGHGGGHSSVEPFSTGCAANISLCAWTFSETGASGPQYPGIGYWTLSSSGSCCDCNMSTPTSGLQANGTYIANDNDTFSYDCNTATSGCSILSNSWKILDKQYGDSTSTPDSLDCTWGYAVTFTGCPASTGACSVTGFAPYLVSDWIPEIYFTSGSSC